jgi:site-specific recombinase XerC
MMLGRRSERVSRSCEYLLYRTSFHRLDTLARVSEIVGLNAEDSDLDGRTIGVMGRGPQAAGAAW